MPTGIVKNKNRRKRIKIMWCLFTMIPNILVISAPLLAADLSLISADRLQKTSSNWVIIDARPKDEWLSGHIPGARSFDFEDYTRTDKKGTPYRIMPQKTLAVTLGKMGINNQTPIIVYGDTDTSWGGEGWVCWVLTWLGHKGPVRLLDGGIQMWMASDFPLKTGEESIIQEPLVYVYHVREDINITAADIQNNQSVFQLVDTRSLIEWITGRIPGAVHISWKKFYKNKNRQPIGSSEVSALLLDHGINPERPIVYYCTGGIRSGYAWLVHSLSGLPVAINFEGGMAEWEKLFP
jgi:thiosulfate/3-mercaptopyruvate sulfurtransferase